MAIKVVHAMTLSQSLGLVRGQLKYLKDLGYDVKVMCGEGKELQAFIREEGVEALPLHMEREIAPLADLKSLFACMKILRKERPDIVTAGTPKAGLIVTLAAFLTGVPVRIYNVLGLRLETTAGVKRQILLAAEKAAAMAATDVFSVSPSLKEQLIGLGIAPEQKITILGKGSYNGFNLRRFEESEEMDRRVAALREELGISEEHIVLGFTGRMTRDKGVEETVEAFCALQKKHPNLRLLMVGFYEDVDPVKDSVRREIEENPNIIHAGYQEDPVPYYRLMDIFLFLTKREGFGNVSVEASLSGKPVLVADVTGARDTLIDGKTGFLVRPDVTWDVIARIEQLIADPVLRLRLGEEGRAWARQHFSNETVWDEADRVYRLRLTERSAPLKEV